MTDTITDETVTAAPPVEATTTTEPLAETAAITAPTPADVAPKARQPRKSKSLDIERLVDLAAQVAAHETVSLRMFLGFVTTLENEEGALIEDSKGLIKVTLAGIEALSMAGVRGGVDAWAMAARRAVLAAD